VTKNEIRIADRKASSIASVNIDLNSIPRTFDLGMLQYIHKSLFQKTHSWAGKLRGFDTAMNGDIFTPHQDIEHYFDSIITKRINIEDIKCMNKDELISFLARCIGNICQIHPFNDGNGRSQRVFLSCLCDEIGFTLYWHEIPKWENKVIFQNAHRDQDFSGIENVIFRIIHDKQLAQVDFNEWRTNQSKDYGILKSVNPKEFYSKAIDDKRTCTLKSLAIIEYWLVTNNDKKSFINFNYESESFNNIENISKALEDIINRLLLVNNDTEEYFQKWVEDRIHQMAETVEWKKDDPTIPIGASLEQVVPNLIDWEKRTGEKHDPFEDNLYGIKMMAVR